MLKLQSELKLQEEAAEDAKQQHLVASEQLERQMASLEGKVRSMKDENQAGDFMDCVYTILRFQCMELIFYIYPSRNNAEIFNHLSRHPSQRQDLQNIAQSKSLKLEKSLMEIQV